MDTPHTEQLNQQAHAAMAQAAAPQPAMAQAAAAIPAATSQAVPHAAVAHPALAPQPTSVAQSYTAQGYTVIQPKGWGRMWAAFALAFAVLVIQVFAMLFGGVLSYNDDAMMTVGEIAGGVIALLFILLLGGRKLAAPSMEGMRESWRIIKWIFIVDAVVALFDLVSVVFFDDTYTLAPMWPLRILILVLMCAGIGLFEEATFRGLIFHGLLARMGASRKGVAWAVVISSVIFGLMHVDPISMDWTDPSQMLQALLKVLQTGIFGVAAAAAVLKTGNIWPVALLHGLNDFILMVMAYGMTDEEITTEYVMSGDDGLAAIAIYVILCVAYIPALIAAIRTIKELPVPDRGQFYKTRTFVTPPAPVAQQQLAYTYVGGQPAYTFVQPQQAAMPAQYIPSPHGYPVQQGYTNPPQQTRL